MAAKPIRKQQGGKAALKLLLIPFAYVYYRLMLLMDLRQMEFLERFMDAWGVKDYLPSLIVLLIALIGLGLLIAFAPAKRAGTALGFVLLLLPAWYLGPTRVGPIGALAYGALELEPAKLICGALMALWGWLLLRGNERTEWVKPVFALLLAAANVFCYMSRSGLPDWYEIARIMALSLAWGLAVDIVCNGFSLQALLPCLAVLSQWLLLDAHKLPALYAALGLGAAGAIVLILTSPVKKRQLGGAAACLGTALNALLMLLWMHKM